MAGFYNSFRVILRAFFLKRNLAVGRWAYIGRRFKVYQWGPEEKVVIGKFCSIADNVKIFAGGEHGHKRNISNYPIAVKLCGDFRYPGHESKGPVVIGNDVWIGSHVIVLSGVNIGDGAVIGAGAVVAKDIPAYAIACGNPAIVIGYRFNEEAIRGLLKIKWWDWEEGKIRQDYADFYGSTDEFIKKHGLTHKCNVGGRIQ